MLGSLWRGSLDARPPLAPVLACSRATLSGRRDPCDGCDGLPTASGRHFRQFAGGGNTTDGTFAPVIRHGTSAASRTPGLAEKVGREGDALNGTSRLDSDRGQDMGGLASLPGLETVSEQLAGPIAVLRVE
jgi:hypothetical protein